MTNTQQTTIPTAKNEAGGNMAETIVWPKKTRELHNHHFDSTIWNDFRFRDDDIIIATYAKSGTTWMQQIIAQLLFGPDPDLAVAEMSPVARPARPAEGGEAADGGGADAPTVPEDAPARGCARLLAQGEVHLHRPRRTRRRVEHVQPPRQREPDLVRGAERHARARRAAHRAASRRHPPVLARLDGPRRPSLLAVLGERPHLVGDSATSRTCCSCTSRISNATCRDRCAASRRSSTFPSTRRGGRRSSSTARSTG